MKLTTFLFFTFLLMASSSFSQALDNQLWLGANVGLKLNKKFTVSLREEFRFGDILSIQRLNFTELGLKYKINKHFPIVPQYRFINVYNKKNWRRISFDLNYSLKKKDFPLSFKYRFRLQDSKKQNSNKQHVNYIRNKIAFSYNASKLVDPYIAYELFYRFDNKNEFRKTRLTLGLDWKLNKKMNLKTFYRTQKIINIKNPFKYQIFGVSFSYKFSLKDFK